MPDAGMFFCKQIYKPDSVANGHLSGHIVTDMFMRFKKNKASNFLRF